MLERDDIGRMKKILHLFRVEKFTEGFVEFINNNFKNEINIFWIHGDKFLDEEYDYLKYQNIEYIPRIDIKMNKMFTVKQLKEFDLIIYHWVMDTSVIHFFYENKKLLKKLVLYFWGGDKKLYGNRKEKMEKRYVITHASALVTIIPQEYREILSNYRPKGKMFSAMYDDVKIKQIIENNQKLPSKECNTINIQIDNSAFPEYQHIEIMNCLCKFKKENIKIFVPLSYGNMDYSKKVIEYGKKIFGNKFIPVQHLVSKEEYYHRIRSMNIAIIGGNKQHALGNIYALMRFGCKVYFYEKSFLYDFFAKGLECKIYPIDQIDKMDFNEFIKYSYEERIENREKVCKYWNTEKLINDWKKIFAVF